MTLSFEKRVLEITREIPRGRVSTYKEIAKKLGNRNLARAVGNALNKNPYSSVPCHRVICSDGRVGGYAKGTKKKISLLESEGVFVKYRRADLKKFGFSLKKK